jgi:RNA polymerase sigma-70 factor (ECF subfamily)
MSADVNDEHTLIRRIQAGEHECFRVLVDAYKDRIVSLAYRQTGDRAMAEDLAQEAFVKAFRSVNRFRFDSSFRTWFTRIALNVMNSYFTSRAFKERALTQAYDADAYEGFLRREASQFEKEDLSLVRSLLTQLDSKFRDAVVLVLVEGWTYEEAAKVLGVPIGTVSSRVTKGIALIRKHFERRSA